MSAEIWIILILVVLSGLGIAWPKIAGLIKLSPADSRSPDAFQRRMDLINALLKECENCEPETKAVITAGDVIAKHWLEDDSTEGKTK